jgi:UDPglucose 6-dehydrogenase
MAKNIVVIGTGYVGLVSGACFAEIGHNVVCVDKDKAKIDGLHQGKMPIYEPGLDEVVARNVKNKRLQFSTKLDLNSADAVFLAVGTPTDPKTQNADMTAFFAAAREVSSALKNKTVVVTKSTVPVGTGAKLKEIFSDKANIVSNPEFLREGNAIHDFMHPDRVVIGADSEIAAKLVEEIYAPLAAKIMHTSIASSELIKYASNSFLAAKVVFINEIADFCERVGANVEDVARGMGMDARIGDKFLKAGPGIGGSCFPKDARALAVQSEQAGAPSQIIDALIESNEQRKIKMAERIVKLVGKGTVAIFGLTFKANTNDMREAASLTIIPLLQKAGLKVKAYDPEGMEEAKHFLPDLEYCVSAAEAADGADGVVILTEWDEFAKMDYAKLQLKRNLVIDLRNILNPANMKKFEYHSIGR